MLEENWCKYNSPKKDCFDFLSSEKQESDTLNKQFNKEDKISSFLEFYNIDSSSTCLLDSNQNPMSPLSKSKTYKLKFEENKSYMSSIF